MRAYFPGSFNPPTYGHLEVLRRACEIFSEVIVVCSDSNDKKYDDDQPTRAWLWHGYNLPANCVVATFDKLKHDPEAKVAGKTMVRGIRNDVDLEYEAKIQRLNHEEFNFSNFLYIYTDQEFADISSSRVRQAIQKIDLQILASMVCPRVLEHLLQQELCLGSHNIVLVVGPPAGGKTSILKGLNPEQYSVIYADDFNQQLQPLIASAFPDESIVDLALNRQDKLSAVIKTPWFELLQTALRKTKPNTTVLVEAAWGLCPERHLWEYLTPNVLYIGSDRKTHLERNIQRGTPHLAAFIDKIPDRAKSILIAEREGLSLRAIDTTTLQSTREDLARYFETTGDDKDA